MSHYAQLDENDVVTRVLVIEQDVIATGLFGDPNSFVQTSYNTLAGKHLLGGTPLRKNFAGIGYTYDRSRDAFIPPKPFSSWSLNEDTCQWDAPFPQPVGTDSVWNEETLSWIIT